MKTKIGKFFVGRDSKVTVLLIFSLFIFVGLGCRGGSSDSKPIPAAYLGDWEGQDGSTLSIRADGKGDYRAGSTKVEGGTAEVDETAKTVSVTFFGIGKTLKIDQPPAGDQMKLDGVMYRRKGGFSTTTTGQDTASTSSTPFSSSGDTSSGDAPSKSEVEALVKESMADFADALEQGDFTDFHANSSKDFQSTFTPEQLKTTFQTYLNNKNIVLPVLNSVPNTSATFTDGPRIRTENGLKIVVANGSFPTKQRTTKFETDYIWRNGEWKLLKFKINM